MGATGEAQVSLEGRVLPPVHPHSTLFLIRTDDPATERYADASDMLLGRSQQTELHWASLLATPATFTVEADPQEPDRPTFDKRGHMRLLDYNVSKDLNTAQLVEKNAYSHTGVGELAGLMVFRTFAPMGPSLSPHTRELTDALDIILWADGSVTSFEFQRSANGSLRAGAMWPPIGGLDQLALDNRGPANDPQEADLRQTGNWKLYYQHSALLGAIGELYPTSRPENRVDRDPRLHLLLQPSREAAAAARRLLKQQIAQHIRATAADHR